MSLLLRSLPAVALRAKSSIPPRLPLLFLTFRRLNSYPPKLLHKRAFSSIYASASPSETLSVPTPKQPFPPSAEELEWVNRTALCGELSEQFADASKKFS
ncbi:hypothetical protein ABFX02_04G074600 [Erythranthe guttata]